MKAVRPIAFSAAFVLSTTLVPGGEAFAQGGMWRPDPAIGAVPAIESAAFRPGTPAFQGRVSEPQPHGGFAAAAPRYRVTEGRDSFGPAAFTGAVPTWRSPSRPNRASEHQAPVQGPWNHWAAAPMPAPLPWSAPLPPAAPAHAGYLAYNLPPMPVWGHMQPVQWQPAAVYHGYPYGRQPTAYRPAAARTPAQWNAPAPGTAHSRPVAGGWRPDPLAASMAADRYRAQASAYTSPRHPVFRGAPVADARYAQVRPAVRPQAAQGYWRPDTAVAWTSSQVFRPVAYGRSIARNEQPVRAAADAAQHSRGDLPGWATTLDRFEETGLCTWCSSGT